VKVYAGFFAVPKQFAHALIGAAVTLLWALPAHAHHSIAMFDPEKRLTLSGTVREFQFTNPHCFIQLMVPSEGAMVEWSVELASPAHLIRSGWKRNTLKTGDKITVIISRARDGSNGGLFLSGTGDDGKAIGAPP
jgi:hypothetical protein